LNEALQRRSKRPCPSAGGLQEFKGGIMKILEQQPVPVIPMVRPFRRGWFNRVGLNVGAPMAASEVQPEVLRERVKGLLAQG
jgi:hypothetical protein